jgi:hypothetical protein
MCFAEMGFGFLVAVFTTYVLFSAGTIKEKQPSLKLHS